MTVYDAIVFSRTSGSLLENKRSVSALSAQPLPPQRTNALLECLEGGAIIVLRANLSDGSIGKREEAFQESTQSITNALVRLSSSVVKYRLGRNASTPPSSIVLHTHTLAARKTHTLWGVIE